MNPLSFIELAHPTDPRYLPVHGSLLEFVPSAPPIIKNDDLFGGLYGRPLISERPLEAEIVARYVPYGDDWRLA